MTKFQRVYEAAILGRSGEHRMKGAMLALSMRPGLPPAPSVRWGHCAHQGCVA